jgi:hypothetical protein
MLDQPPDASCPAHPPVYLEPFSCFFFVCFFLLTPAHEADVAASGAVGGFDKPERV